MPKMEGYLGACWEVYALVSEGGIKQKITWSGRVFYKQTFSSSFSSFMTKFEAWCCIMRRRCINDDGDEEDT
jgi:hypothetical protein